LATGLLIEVNRFADLGDTTLGCLSINGKPKFFTCEDGYNEPKVQGETMIPEGRYLLKERKVLSPLTKKYRARYNWFRWHLELQGVDGFKYIYFHVGNYSKDSNGCILVGAYPDISRKAVYSSRKAFKEFYHIVMSGIRAGALVTVEVR